MNRHTVWLNVIFKMLQNNFYAAKRRFSNTPTTMPMIWLLYIQIYLDLALRNIHNTCINISLMQCRLQSIDRLIIMRTKGAQLHEYLGWCIFIRLFMSLKIGLISREIRRAALFPSCILCRSII